MLHKALSYHISSQVNFRLSHAHATLYIAALQSKDACPSGI